MKKIFLIERVLRSLTFRIRYLAVEIFKIKLLDDAINTYFALILSLD
jgi:hypothetical protein